MNNKSRTELYTAELEKLNSLIDPAMDENKRTSLQGLIEEAAFCRASLVELKDEIRKHGYVETYRNGANQSGKKDSCYVKAYNLILKSYMSAVKLLAAFDFSVDGGSDDFDKFLKSG